MYIIYTHIWINKHILIHKQIFMHLHTHGNNYTFLVLYITLLNWLLTVQRCGHERYAIIASFREILSSCEGNHYTFISQLNQKEKTL